MEGAFQANLDSLNSKNCSESAPNQVKFHANTQQIYLPVCPRKINAQEYLLVYKYPIGVYKYVGVYNVYKYTVNVHNV